MYFSPHDSDLWGFNYSFACLQTRRAIFGNRGGRLEAHSRLKHRRGNICAAVTSLSLTWEAYSLANCLFWEWLLELFLVHFHLFFPTSNCSFCSKNRGNLPSCDSSCWTQLHGSWSLSSERSVPRKATTRRLRHKISLISLFTEPSL